MRINLYTGNIAHITNLALDNTISINTSRKSKWSIKKLDENDNFKQYLEPIIKEELGLTSFIKELHFAKVFNKNACTIVFDDNYTTTAYNKNYYELLVTLGNIVACLELLANGTKKVVTLEWKASIISEDWYTYIAMYIVKKLSEYENITLNIITHDQQLIRSIVLIAADLDVSEDNVYVHILVTKKDKTLCTVELNLNMAKLEILQNHKLVYKTSDIKLDYDNLVYKFKKQEGLED